MSKPLRTMALTLLALCVMDVTVALVLSTVAPSSLRRYFDYGRSVPGKLAEWEAHPNAPYNLMAVAWPDVQLAQSAERATRRDVEADSAPQVHSYGMSFTQRMIVALHKTHPDMPVQELNGPGIPPNFSYALFLDDRPNRRPGDVVLLGILSSSLRGMGSYSNRVWAFEQPAPLTYPVFRPDGNSLKRDDPAVRTLADERDPAKHAAFMAQISRQDAMHRESAFAWPVLDHSPLMRLIRRSVALGDLRERTAELLRTPNGPLYAWGKALPMMVADFVRICREDGQVPVVMLIQSKNPADVDLQALLSPTLAASQVPTISSAELIDLHDPASFQDDGHYTPAMDARLAAHALQLPAFQSVVDAHASH